MEFDWFEIARKEQLPPEGDWRVWLLLAGRGFGKTRAGSEAINLWVKEKTATKIGLIGFSQLEVRNLMIFGTSGLFSVAPIDNKPKIKENRLIWPNGSEAFILGSQNLEKLRGYEFDTVWIDEFAKLPRPKALWDLVKFTIRSRDRNRIIITTTPRPLPILKELISHEGTVISGGSTFENALNLNNNFIKKIESLDSSFAKQEVMANIIWDDIVLWKKEDIIQIEKLPPLSNKIICVDPALSCHENSHETGIIVIGLGIDCKVYVLADYSLKQPVNIWLEVINHAFCEYKVNKILVENNQGGNLYGALFHSKNPLLQGVLCKIQSKQDS